jgi:hypothetical protein
MASAPIVEVVRLPGGNGLASPLFEMPSEFFRVFSWQHIEIGTEALIVDGEVLRQSDGIVNPFGLLFRKQYARRVLLRPAPLTDIQASALTQDQLDLRLTLSINYVVRDPMLVASMEAPITTLTQLSAGIAAEHIRGSTLAQIVGDEGALRVALREKMNASPSLHEAFEIIEVLKAVPEGDERLIEIIRQTRAEKSRASLITAQGKNLLAEEQVARQIARMRLGVDEERKEADHQRVMVLREAELRAQNLQSMAAAMALAASTGTDTAKLAEMFLRMTGIRGDTPALPTTDESGDFPLLPADEEAENDE